MELEERLQKLSKQHSEHRRTFTLSRLAVFCVSLKLYAQNTHKSIDKTIYNAYNIRINRKGA
nr:MAG TPA: hypothetical protein [Caudoviricetes sp.]DAZ11489.1 MAG TPA: hypothetical protein [Caudoviricetes sp.]